MADSLTGPRSHEVKWYRNPVLWVSLLGMAAVNAACGGSSEGSSVVEAGTNPGKPVATELTPPPTTEAPETSSPAVETPSDQEAQARLAVVAFSQAEIGQILVDSRHPLTSTDPATLHDDILFYRNQAYGEGSLMAVENAFYYGEGTKSLDEQVQLAGAFDKEDGGQYLISGEYAGYSTTDDTLTVYSRVSEMAHFQGESSGAQNFDGLIGFNLVKAMPSGGGVFYTDGREPVAEWAWQISGTDYMSEEEFDSLQTRK